MPTKKTDLLATRATLLGRLKEWDNQSAWTEFNQAYWRLLHNFTLKLGVPENDAKDVVQETLVAVAKAIRGFQYDPSRCSFKSWLLGVARNRVMDYFRRHPRGQDELHRPLGDTARTSTVERIPDPHSSAAASVWDEEWRSNIVELALERLKTQVSIKHFQIFYLHVIKQQAAAKAARALGVGTGQVYLVKHRLKGTFAKIVAKLEQDLDDGARAETRGER